MSASVAQPEALPQNKEFNVGSFDSVSELSAYLERVPVVTTLKIDSKIGPEEWQAMLAQSEKFHLSKLSFKYGEHPASIEVALFEFFVPACGSLSKLSWSLCCDGKCAMSPMLKEFLSQCERLQNVSLAFVTDQENDILPALCAKPLKSLAFKNSVLSGQSMAEVFNSAHNHSLHALELSAVQLNASEFLDHLDSPSLDSLRVVKLDLCSVDFDGLLGRLLALPNLGLLSVVASNDLEDIVCFDTLWYLLDFVTSRVTDDRSVRIELELSPRKLRVDEEQLTESEQVQLSHQWWRAVDVLSLAVTGSPLSQPPAMLQQGNHDYKWQRVINKRNITLDFKFGETDD